MLPCYETTASRESANHPTSALNPQSLSLAEVAAVHQASPVLADVVLGT